MDSRLALGFVGAVVSHVLLLVVLGMVRRTPTPRDPFGELVVIHVTPARPDPVREEPPPPPPPAAQAPARPDPAPPRRRRATARPLPAPAVRDDRSTALALPATPGPPDPVPDEPPAPAAPEPVGAQPQPGPPAPATPRGPIVSARPRYRSNPKPEYPIQALRRRQEGVVLLDVAVRAAGTPSSVRLKKSSGHPVLDQAAVDAVWRWTFEPARVDGAAIASDVEVPVRFSLSTP